MTATDAPADPDPDVWEAPDGRLFLTGGAHRVLDQLTGRLPPAPGAVAAFAANQNARATLCRKAGIGFSMWVFPDPLVAQRDSLAGLEAQAGPLASPYLTHYAPAVAGLPVIYPLPALAGRPACFARTDSHYSDRGFLRIAILMLDRCHPGLGRAYGQAALAAATALPPEERQRRMTGDLGRKFTPPRREKMAVVPRPAGYAEVSNGVQGNMGGLVLIESPAGQRDETLLVFGDSFFRNLFGALAWGWRRVVFCRSPYLHAELIPAVAPATILCGTAERYLSAVRPDSDRPHALALPLLAGHRMLPDPGFAAAFARLIDQRSLIGTGLPGRPDRRAGA